MPHLTIEDVTQQVLAAQEKASKPATLDSIIGKYSDDEEVDEENQTIGRSVKKFCLKPLMIGKLIMIHLPKEEHGEFLTPSHS